MTDHKTTLELPSEVPIVPVPEHVLLPGFPQPYPVFESRYMAMLGDLAKLRTEDRWVAVPRMVSRYGAHYRGKPEFYATATIGRVVQARRTGDGHAEMTIMGEARVHLDEVPSDRPYRKASARLIPDAPCSPAEERLQLDRLLQASVDLMNVLGPLAQGLDALLKDRTEPGRLLYRVASVLIHDPDRRMPLLEELKLSTRVDVVLDAMTDLMTMAAHSPLKLKDPAAA